MLPPFFLSVRVPTLLAIWWLRFRRESASVPHKEPPSLILFRLDSMGDVVLTTPLFAALKKARPKSRCTVVVQQAYRSLLVTNPCVDEVLCIPAAPDWMPKGLGRLLAAVVFYWTHLRKRRFDFAISPRYDADEHLATLLCVLTNGAQRIGYSARVSARKAVINRAFDKAFDICLPAGPAQHEVERNLAVARALGASACDGGLEIRITDHDRREASKHLDVVPGNARLIAVGIGAASAGRRWPVDRYAATLEALNRRQTFWPAIVCAHQELDDARKFQSRFKGRAVILCDAPLREVCAVLQRCELFIGNDSGCAHLAAAMGCKTLVISRHPAGGDPDHFNSPVRFAPWGADVKVLQPEIGRDACDSACVVPAPHCILGVSVDSVVAEARRFVDSSAAATPKATPAQPPKRVRRVATPMVVTETLVHRGADYKGPSL